MPINYCSAVCIRHIAVRKQAEEDVSRKFPHLPRNSSGWAKAYHNRVKRLLS